MQTRAEFIRFCAKLFLCMLWHDFVFVWKYFQFGCDKLSVFCAVIANIEQFVGIENGQRRFAAVQIDAQYWATNTK